jgi:hypothetical protein
MKRREVVMTEKKNKDKEEDEEDEKKEGLYGLITD